MKNDEKEKYFYLLWYNLYWKLIGIEVWMTQLRIYLAII